MTKILIIISFSFFLISCGNNKNEESQTTSSELEVLKGTFVDSPVAGLNFKTPSRSGKTTEKGEFEYLKGEKILFSVGDIKLGESLGNKTITPLSLVPDAKNYTHPKVINIVRFLLTVNENADSKKGIKISSEVIEASKGLQIDFSNKDLSLDPALIKLLKTIKKTTIVDSTTAQSHFSTSLKSQSTWGVMTWGQGKWQDPNFLAQQSFWGDMRWGAGSWQRKNLDL